VDRLTSAKDTYTIHIPVFQGVSAIVAYIIFRATIILTLHRYLSAVEHRHHNSIATTVDQLT